MPSPHPQRGGPGLGPVSRCRSCGAPIQWAYTPVGGNMPIDYPVDLTGAAALAAWGRTAPTAPNVALVDGFAVVLGTLEAEHTPTLVPHWATCPDSVAWQGRDKGGTR